MDDPHDFTPDWQMVEMPARVKSMETIDGRLIVTLIDGRTIDMTDWYATDGASN